MSMLYQTKLIHLRIIVRLREPHILLGGGSYCIRVRFLHVLFRFPGIILGGLKGLLNI